MSPPISNDSTRSSSLSGTRRGIGGWPDDSIVRLLSVASGSYPTMIARAFAGVSPFVASTILVLCLPDLHETFKRGSTSYQYTPGRRGVEAPCSKPASSGGAPQRRGAPRHNAPPLRLAVLPVRYYVRTRAQRGSLPDPRPGARSPARRIILAVRTIARGLRARPAAPA